MQHARRARFVAVFTLLVLSAIAIFVWRHRRVREPTPVTGRPLVVPAARPAGLRRSGEDGGGRALRLADAAFLYERAVIELCDLTESTKLRALRLLAHVIVPLVGELAVEDLPAVVAGVRQVLADENKHDPGALIVWNDFARWTQVHVLHFRLPWTGDA